MTIINRSLSLIFLKSYKTASTSVEIFLITQTPLGQDIYETSQDITRYGYARKRRNHALLRGDGKYWSGLSFGENLQRKIFGNCILFPSIGQHSDIRKIKDIAGESLWEKSEFRVTTVRNPWDLIVSRYEWDRSGRGGRGQRHNIEWNNWLEKYLEAFDDRSEKSPFEHTLNRFLFEEDGGLGITHAVYFEDIEGGLRDLSESLDVKMNFYNLEKFHEKKTKRKSDYREYFTDKQAEAVQERAARFLEKFNYTFEGVGSPPSDTIRLDQSYR